MDSHLNDIMAYVETDVAESPTAIPYFDETSGHKDVCSGYWNAFVLALKALLIIFRHIPGRLAFFNFGAIRPSLATYVYVGGAYLCRAQIERHNNLTNVAVWDYVLSVVRFFSRTKQQTCIAVQAVWKI